MMQFDRVRLRHHTSAIFLNETQCSGSLGVILVDGPQALLLKELPYFLEDVQIAREAYEKRIVLNRRYLN